MAPLGMPERRFTIQDWQSGSPLALMAPMNMGADETSPG